MKIEDRREKREESEERREKRSIPLFLPKILIYIVMK